MFLTGVGFSALGLSTGLVLTSSTKNGLLKG